MYKNGYFDLVFNETESVVDEQYVKRILKIKMFIKDQIEMDPRYDYKRLYKAELTKFIENLPY